MSDKDSPSSQERQRMDWAWIIATALILGLAHAAARFAKPVHSARVADPEMREVQVDPLEVPHPIYAED